MQFGNLTLKQCRYGWMLFTTEGPLYVGKCLELYGQYSEGEVVLMRALLREGATAIEVGANIGALTIPMSQVVGPTGRIYAAEADPDTFNVLCANLALNGVRNTLPLNVFVADSPIGSSGTTGESWRNGVLSLDSLELKACDFIKIDVDGSELSVLRSAEMQIERFRPTLYFENELRDKSVELMTFVLRNLGYDLFYHQTPLFDAENYSHNPVNHWAPTQFVSMMMLGFPREQKVHVELKRVEGPDDWWDYEAPLSSYFLR
jgi:hypothetical protein